MEAKKGKLTKRFGVGLLFGAFCLSLASCTGELKYHAMLYVDCDHYLKESFIEENPIVTTYEPHSSWTVVRSSYPILLVQDQETFDYAFSEESGFTMDFSKRIAVVHCLRDFYNDGLSFKSISVKNRQLNIVLKSKHVSVWGHGGARQPYPRWVVVTLDKVDVDSVSITYRSTTVSSN